MTDYQWNASDYLQHSKGQQKWARELISKLHLKGTEAILDIGCGDGKITAEISTSIPNGTITGIDSSPEMISLAQNRFPAEQYPNLTFRLLDAAKMDFEEQFDTIFSNAALHWLTDHKPLLTCIYNSLRPKGKILLQMGGKGNAEKILSVIEEIQTMPEWQQYFKDLDFPYGFFGTQEYSDLLGQSGFHINRVELIPKDMEHVRKTGLEGWIRTTWLPYTNRIPEKNKREKFINTIASKYLERVPLDSLGNAHVAMVRLEVEANKLS